MIQKRSVSPISRIKKSAGHTQPLVSVILPTFNAEAYVAEAIQSILNQTYRRFELVIVDDASTDKTWQIVQGFRQKFPQKIKAVRLRKNLNSGGDAAGSRAFQLTNPKSEFIARMDADDRALPHRLAVEVAYLQTHPQVAVVGSSALVINDQGEVTGEKNVTGSASKISQQFFKTSPMIHPTVMIRRSAIVATKTLYRLDLSANNDYLTFAELASKGRKLVNLSEQLLEYRVHNSNDSIKNLKRTLFNTIIIRWRMVREFGYQPSLLNWAIFLAQVIGLSWWPEAWLRAVYLLVRGMVSPTIWFESLQRKQSNQTVVLDA
jgi:glycosyltransferase EpsE